MKIIRISDTLRLFPDDLTVEDRIPTGTYSVEFDNMSGYSLKQVKNFKNTIKVYGDHNMLVDKILSRYELSERNFGAILGGRKGTGKSMMARIISEKLLDKDIPTLLVTQNTPGIDNFLKSIEQPVLVLIDEFEKVFSKTKEEDEQSQFLNVVDGFHSHKHFYLITINDYDKLNEYFIGRTGRFYYNIEFGRMEVKEIEEYLKDTVKQTVSPSLVSLLYRLSVNYDQLSAIVRELNLGETVENILKYLNLGISESTSERYEMIITFDNGGQHISRQSISALSPETNIYVNQYVRTPQGDYLYDFAVDIPIDAFDFLSDDIKVDMSQIHTREYNTRDDDEDMGDDRHKNGRAQDIVDITFRTIRKKYVY